MKFKYAYGAAPGISDSGRVTECQDTVKIIENGVSVISLADPAVTAKAAAALMAERFDELYASGDDFIKNVILENIKELSGMDCALLFVAVKENHYLAGHMGGGLVAGFNGSCLVLSKPELEDQDVTNLRIYKGDMQEPIGFMLMSSGACQSLYEYSTGNLSPACSTFFEWLKEYDEERVSEALAENINKYFLKNTEGDISVAVMVSDQNDTEPVAERLETSEPDGEPKIKQDGETVREAGKNKNLIKYVIAVIVVLAAIFVCTLIPSNVTEPKDTTIAEAKPPVTNSVNNEPSVTLSVDNPESYDAGEYKVGVDIPAGEYFFWTGEMLKPGSIVVNDDTCLSDELYCMTIQLNEWDTLVSDYRFTAAENVNPVTAKGGVLISGKYKIGKDIAPGTYKVSPINKNAEGRYYSIFEEDISNDTKFSDDTTVVVPEEGYVVLYNSVLVVEEK